MEDGRADCCAGVSFHRRKTDGLFLEVCQEASKNYPDIKFDDCLLDRACLNVRRRAAVSPAGRCSGG